MNDNKAVEYDSDKVVGNWLTETIQSEKPWRVNSGNGKKKKRRHCMAEIPNTNWKKTENRERERQKTKKK